MKKQINHHYFYPHPPETVWDYLTKPELMEQWLMKNNFQPIVGVDFQFRTSPVASLNFDGVFYCTVLDVVPFKRLSYSWRGGEGKDRITVNSVVVWTLQPTDKGTELFLEHSGFENEESLKFYEGLNHGWPEKLQNIANLLNPAPHDRVNA